MSYASNGCWFAASCVLVAGVLATGAAGQAGWQIESVAGMGGNVVPPALVFDGQDRANVVYGDSGGVRHARATGAGAIPGWASSVGLNLSYSLGGGPVYLAAVQDVLYLGFHQHGGRTPYGYLRVFDGTDWQPYVTDSSSGQPPYGLVTDAAGQPHWVMYHSTTGSVGYKVYTYAGGAGTYTPLAMNVGSPVYNRYDDDGPLLQGGEAVLDAGGNLHFLQYLDAGGGTLLYANGPLGGPFQVDDNFDPSWKVKLGLPSLAVDAGGTPHIAYTEQWPTYGLKYLTRSGDGWASEYIETGGDIGAYVGTSPDVLVDAAGQVHVFYADLANGLLKHAVKQASGWQIESIDTIGTQATGGVLAGSLSAAIDSTGGIGVAYYDAASSSLKYAYMVPEPATLALLAIGGLAVIRRRRA